jgi:hypothetical protein
MTVGTPLASGGVSKSARVGGIYSITFSSHHKTIFTGISFCCPIAYATNHLFKGTESGDIVGWNLEQLFAQADMKPHDPKKKQSFIALESEAYTSIY